MSRHVQNTDSSVVERRLRPIYEWLDAGNNKKAVQECDKVLKKSPNILCAKALKALAFLRMSRKDDCVSLLDHILTKKPVDESTLQVMSLCYREMHEMEKICTLYDMAVKLDPTNEDLQTQLFMSYVKVNDYKAQQQTAMALYKQKPKNPYYCWNVMSIVLQATRGEGRTDPAKRTLLLSLAERMMKKLHDDNKIDAEQEVQLYILVLNLEEKYEDVLELLNGPLGGSLQALNLSQVKLEFATKLKDWRRVNSLCKLILQESFDRWEYWVQYINSVFELIDSNEDINLSEGSFSNVDNTVEKCHEFICSMIEGGADNQFLLRGPYLARFELCAKLQEKNIETYEFLGDSLELFMEYFRKFGHKSCCVSDLKVYLYLLDDEQKIVFGSRLVKEVGVGGENIPQTMDKMLSHIGSIQLARLCGAHRNLPQEHLQTLVTALILHYRHGYQAHGKGLTSTDFGPSDNYSILACHLIYDLSILEGGANFIVAGLAVLETLLTKSPNNFHAKLLALKFYHLLGNGLAANNVFYSLDIKHLQLDSLGFIHCAHLATSGLFSVCALHYDTTLKFFTSSFKESTDHFTLSYKYGSFIKLDEFMDFRERMESSLHYMTVVFDRMVLSLMDCSSVDTLYNMEISFKAKFVDFCSLRDNRDLDIYLNWDPEFASQKPSQCEVAQESFKQDVNFLKLRSHMLWAVGAAIFVAKTGESEKEANLAALLQLVEEWKEMESELRCENPQPTPQNLLSYPPVSRLHGQLATPYQTCLTSILEFFVELCKNNLEEAEIKFNAAEKEIGSLVNKLETKLLIGVELPYFQPKKKEFELFVNTLEVVCLACVICMVSNEAVKPPQSKKGKKKLQLADMKTKELHIRLVECLKLEVNKLSELLVKWSSTDTKNDPIETLRSLNLGDESFSLQDSCLESYNLAYKEIQGVINNKVKILNGL
ncbi:phagocyte signaling-impaired protein [Euwallacea fornicatus]|uniref:phagocyte signaling-impaired protein n=1 Tax=Euwallacea fornicatus TaxID=995702 RepID=UPI00338EE22E